MPQGPGKYDDLATHVRVSTNAAAVVVIVFDGNKGSGFSMQAETDSPDVYAATCATLRAIADQIQKDMSS